MPDFNDDLADFDTIIASAPPPPTTTQGFPSSPLGSPERTQCILGKRTRTEDEELEEDCESHDNESDYEATPSRSRSSAPTPLGTTRANKNFVAYARRVATQKRLRTEDTAELLEFVADTSLGREVRLYAGLLATSRRLEAIVQSQPSWEPSEDLTTNIKAYALGILLSSKLESYKGKIVTEHLERILKRKRFDLPPGIEKNPAAWKKIRHLIDDAFTQYRSSIKKALAKSVQGSPEEHQTIYDLTTSLCEDTLCTPSLLLCARLAFLRYMYLKNPKRDMWDTIDKALENVRTKSANNVEKVTQYFRTILNKDRQLHGASEHDNFDDVVATDSSEWQQEIDDTVAGI